MTARVISLGAGDGRALVVMYLVPSAHEPGRPSLDDQIREALPGACVIAFADADGEPLRVTQERARQLGWTVGPTILGGYSAGCLRGVRRRLLEGAAPAGVVAIDGPHASMPPTAWQLDHWRAHFEAARAGRELFVATHTLQTYVERLPGQQRYQATVTTLRQITGWPLADAGPLPLGVEHVDGDAHVHSYASAEIDGAAHSAQLLTVLPEMLRRHVASWLAARGALQRSTTPAPATLPTGAPRNLRAGDRGPDVGAWQRHLHALGYDPGAADEAFGPVTLAATRAYQRAYGLHVDGVVGPATRAAAERALTPPPDRPTTPTDVDLGAALLEQARADLAAGVRETDGRNDGPRIREYFAGTGAPRGSAWCAAAVRFWLRMAAAKCRATTPIQGSVSARATAEQLRRAGRWMSAEELRAHPGRLQPGQLVVWWRERPGGPYGHIGVVSTTCGEHFTSIDGNGGPAGDRVAEMPHDLGEERLLGAGWVN